MPLLGRKGERALPVITRGFCDALRIAYRNRPHIFAHAIEIPGCPRRQLLRRCGPLPAEAVRPALDLNKDVPVIFCDAREREFVKDVLIEVVAHAAAHPADRRADITI